MGIQDLQTFMESKSVIGGAVNVDLLRIARNLPQRPGTQMHRGGRGNRNNPLINKFKLVVDGECCLDRLYGGFFSDWACGGQWNRTIQFLSLLIQAVENGNIELAVVFNGALEPQRMAEWKAAQAQTRERVIKVLKHINTKGTPPPKVWWTAPVCLRTVLRMALRHLGVTVLCSMDDHHQEVIGYCRENSYHGLMADDAEYAVFDPPRYFSSEYLKLTYKGSLETKEYMVTEMDKILDLNQEQLCIVAALLGNYLLTEIDLKEFYNKIGAIEVGEKQVETLVKSVATFVKGLPEPNNLDSVAIAVFGSLVDRRSTLLRHTVQYYLNGTKEGFLRYRPNVRRNGKKGKDKDDINGTIGTNQKKTTEDQDLDMSGFASETLEREQKSLEDYKLATANAVLSAPDIVINNSTESENGGLKLTSGSTDDYESAPNPDNLRLNGQINGTVQPPSALLISSSSSSSSSIVASPTKLLMKRAEKSEENKLLHIAPEVLRTASERHQKGLMSPLILQVLSTGEVRFPCLLEDEQHKEIPSIHKLFRPIRQNVYAILFNLHHYQYVAKSKEKEGEKVEIPDITVKEWVWSKGNNYDRPEYIKAEALGWGVPTIQRLWFGSALDDKRRRLRALLTCLRSDTPLMLNPSYVPQHLLIMACVLRYIMSMPLKRILRRQELDAFIAQAFAPELMNSQYLQELTLPLVTSRGVQLATMFMQGVETALFANDACGAPIPWLMCCPWLFFDGKLFHHKLARAAVVKNLLELCENHIEHVVKVERMRKAILEGLNVQFANPLACVGPGAMLRQGLPPPNCLPAMNLPSARIGRGIGRRPVPSRGGQLQIAGVVVGSWGANYGRSQPPMGRQQPQVASVGFGASTRGGRAPGYQIGAHRTYVSLPTKQNRNVGNFVRGKKNGKKKTQSKIVKPKPRGMTVETGTGETVLASELLKTTKESVENVKLESGENVSFDENSLTKNETSAPKVEHRGQGDAPAVLETSR